MRSDEPRALARVGFALVLLCTGAPAAGQTREECESEYQPESGQSGKDVVWVPTDDALVRRMLEMAETTPSDLVYDLGAGDGKIAIAAAKQFGARSIGVEYNPKMAKLAQCLARAEGVSDRATIIRGDIFKTNFSSATVVTLYLLPELNLRLRPTLLRMKPGTRIVSHSFTMAEWEPDDRASTPEGDAYLWIVPARVAGKWTLAPQEGEGERVVLTLDQSYQKVKGSAVAGRSKANPVAATLRGPDLHLTFEDPRGRWQLTGSVKGRRLEAVITDPSGKQTRYLGRRA